MIRKLLLTALAFTIGIGLLWSQRPPQPDKYDVKINGYSISLQSDLNMFAAKTQIQRSRILKEEPEWIVVQFNEIPTTEERSLLATHGVEILNYVGGNAYYASVDPQTQALKSNNVRAFAEINPQFKVSPLLNNNAIPDYVKDGSLIKVVIIYFENADLNGIEKDLAELGLTNAITEPYFHFIRASVPEQLLPSLSNFGWVQSIQPADPPMESENLQGRSLHRANILQSTIPGLGYGLTGKGVKIGLWDTDVDNHRDFNGRLTVREFEVHSSDHGAHTAGTLISAGVIDPRAKGMAPEAEIVAYNFNTQSNKLTVPQERLLALTNDGIEISSNSYGVTPAYCNNASARYVYNITDQAEDQLVSDFPYFLMAYSAGNSQQLSACASIGGYFTTTKNIKNALVVANISAKEEISSTSSFGPTYDGRLIPNISGDGSSIYSTIFGNSYGAKSGTSMATPGVAGTVALLYQRYKETHGNQLPLSSLMRALVYNTAHDLGNPGPDYIFGYGAINGSKAIELMEKGTYFIESVANGDAITKDIEIPQGASALRVMLVWTDEKGQAGYTFPLVNDLDLCVVNGGNTTLPWVLDRNNPSTPATRGYDESNNMEQVTIDNPPQGVYSIKIDGHSVPTGSQEFAIVYDIVMPTLKVTYPIGGESLNLNLGEQLVIRWDSEGYKDPFIVEYSDNGGASYQVIGDNIPNSYRAFLWTMPDNIAITAKAKFRVRCGIANSTSKGFVNIMPTPKNLAASPVQCSGVGTVILQWDAIPSAKYQVLKVTGQEYNVIGEATTNTYTIANPVQGNDSWYSVRAIDNTTGAISERTVAIQVNPADIIKSLPFKENFESQTVENFYFTNTPGYGSAKVDHILTSISEPIYRYGILLTGPSANKGDWVSATGAACFTNNPSYVTSATICNVDATSMLGKQLRLKFDYRKKNNAYFQVKINGTVVASTEGTMVYGTTDQSTYKTLYYNIDAYAGSPTLSITFEAVCKTGRVLKVDGNGNILYGADDDSGDFVAIDNISISDLSPDLAISLPTIIASSANNPIIIEVKQIQTTEEFTPLYNVPVSYQVNDGPTINEVIPGPIVGTSIQYTFSQTANLSAPGLYTIAASVSFPTDLVADNNTATQTIANNTGYFRIGAPNYGGDAQTRALAAGEKLTITHPNGPFFDYKRDGYTPFTTFTPPAGKNIKFTLTQIDMDKDVDYIRVYNGLIGIIGSYTGQIVSDSDICISYTDNGSISVQMYATGALGNSKGFIGTLECVDKPVNDIGAAAIIAPTLEGVTAALGNSETVTVTLKNHGTQAIVGNVDVYYQVNDKTPIHEVLNANIASLATFDYSFTTTCNLTDNGTYTIKAWVEWSSDSDEDNNSTSTTLTKSIDGAIISVNDIYLYRTSKQSAINYIYKNTGTVLIPNGFKLYYDSGSDNKYTTFKDVIYGGLRVGYDINASFTSTAPVLATPGQHTIKVYTDIPNDANPENDEISVTAETEWSSTSTTGRFDGTTIAATEAIAAMNLTKNYTVEFWIYPLRTPTFGRIFDKTNVAIFYQGDPRYSTAYPENTYILSVTTDVGSFAYYYPNTVKQEEWQHIALTVDATGATYTFYINGVEQSPTPYNSGTPAATKSNANIPLYIGNSAALNRGIVGDIDEVRVWNSCLPQATITANMVTDFATDTPNLLAYYKLKEERGSYIFDHSVNDNTALVKGANTSGKGNGYFWNEPVFMTNVDFGADQVQPTVYNPTTKTFTVLANTGADLTSLVNTYTVYMYPDVKVGGALQASGVTANDFSNGPVRYDVEGIGFNSGITQTYFVEVKHDNLSDECELLAYNFSAIDNSSLATDINLSKNLQTFSSTLPFGTDLSSLKASFAVSPGAKLHIAGVEQQNPQTAAMSYSQPLVVTVVAENMRESKVYTIDLIAHNTAAELLEYGILNEQVGRTAMNMADHTVKIWVKNTTNLAMLTPIFTVSPNATLCIGVITQISGKSVANFTNPVSISILPEDEQTVENWTITVINDNFKPVITLIGNADEAITLGSTYIDQGATALDNTGDITTNIVTTSAVDVNTAGTYTIRYNVADAAGNVAEEVTRTVVVRALSELASVDQLFIDGVEHSISQPYIMRCSGSNLLTIGVVGNGVLSDLVASAGAVNQTGPDAFTFVLDTPCIATISFSMISECGNTVEPYQLVVEKQFSFDDIVVQKWNNMLMINLKALREMGYSNVTNIKWYRDGVQIGSGNSYSAGPAITDLLTFTSLYNVEFTSGGHTLRSCAKQPVQQKVSTFAYPNPVARGGKLTVSLDDSILQQTNVVVNIYDMMGVRKSMQNIGVNKSSITAPSTAGIYILELKSDNDVITTMKIIVQ